MYKSSWNKVKLYWLTENEYVNEKKSMLYRKNEVNANVVFEFRNGNVYF